MVGKRVQRIGYVFRGDVASGELDDSVGALQGLISIRKVWKPQAKYTDAAIGEGHTASNKPGLF